MELDELKKEAEEGFKNIKYPTYDKDIYIQAYLASAEPREKRIDCLTLACENYKEEMEKNLADAVKLEKENAELKKKLSEAETDFDKMFWQKNELIQNEKEKLSKAKDHIKKLLDCLQQDTNDPQTNYYVVQYMTEAEQFLSEVEK